MKIAINRLHYPVTTLGFGRRIGLWLQGCTLHCRGCLARDTWVRRPDHEMAIDDVVAWCQQIAAKGIDGVTISGGEPFEQPAALHELLRAMRQWTDTLPAPVDFLCYTGLAWGKAKRARADVLALLDAVIPGPYRQRLPSAPLRGSSNQPIIPLTRLGKERYDVPMLPVAMSKHLQIAVESDAIYFIGIPERGDMEQFESRSAGQGLRFKAVSWRS